MVVRDELGVYLDVVGVNDLDELGVVGVVGVVGVLLRGVLEL